MMKTILFVCTGNSCRSVMAGGLLRRMLKGESDMRILTAGVSVIGGGRASQETIEVMAEAGIDVSDHVTRPLTDDVIKEADIILVMERFHRERILERAPESEDKVRLLTEFARPQQERELVDPDVPDPIGKSIESHRECLEIIKESVERVAKKLTKDR